MTTAYGQVLVEVFRRLTPTQRANLRQHAQIGTPICCGPRGNRCIDWNDHSAVAGCPAQLALGGPPPAVYPTDDGWYVPGFHAAMNLSHRMEHPALGVHARYLEALRLATEDDVRAAILEAC